MPLAQTSRLTADCTWVDALWAVHALSKKADVFVGLFFGYGFRFESQPLMNIEAPRSTHRI